MTKAPERIWAFYAPEIEEDNPGCTIVAGEHAMHGAQQFTRADHALALVAAGRAEVLDAMDAFNTLPPDENGHCWRESDLLDQEVMRLRARTPDDATAALKARDQRIRNEALREVVKVCDELRPATTSSAFEDGYDSGLGTAVVHIEALITEGQSDGED